MSKAGEKAYADHCANPCHHPAKRFKPWDKLSTFIQSLYEPNPTAKETKPEIMLAGSRTGKTVPHLADKVTEGVTPETVKPKQTKKPAKKKASKKKAAKKKE